MTRLYFIRHGRSTWNAEHRIQGRADPPLDEVGREQARRLAERLRGGKPLAALYASSLRRARETADIVGEALDLPVIADDRLREYDVGDLTGLVWAQIEQRFPDVARRWKEADESLEFPGAEPHAQFQAQVVAAVEEIVVQHAEGPVGVVSHGGTIGACLNHLLKIPSRYAPFRFGNASLSIVDVDPVRPRIVLLNDTCHLGGE
ncbi:MAG: histidine phosphatase family protein [bacterium]|nr:histidine phosphatase family protein [bacterium]